MVVESGATSKMEGETTYGARQPNLPTLLPTERGPKDNWQTLHKEKPGKQNFTADDLVLPCSGSIQCTATACSQS